MCGIAGAFGPAARREAIEAMVQAQHHRGPDAQWVYADADLGGAIGSNRLSVIDLSPGADEPLVSPSGTRIAFNGEIYNHVELRRELDGYPFRTHTDTEVLLAAHERWGEDCLDRLIGMFAVIVWNATTGRVLAARDRFGVKPLYHHRGTDGTLWLASEIGTLFSAGIDPRPDPRTWSAYLGSGLVDHSGRTFWEGVSSLAPGHVLRLHRGEVQIEPWYDVATAIGSSPDERPVDQSAREYRDLLEDSVRLRFRSDVPVGVALSGGLDSATLLALIDRLPGDHPPLTAYTFATGDPRYDETRWVQQMIEGTPHESRVVTLSPEEVPDLATSVQASQDEPFGGLPTLAYARLFERARADGTIVLLDGQGMDEQWAGYDYYWLARSDAPVVQGTDDPVARPGCLQPEFRAGASRFNAPTGFADPLLRLQHRDLCSTKLPRALRYNDRISMRSSIELREPFLDHRLVELALRQPRDRKQRLGTSKWLLRRIADDLVPDGVVHPPKRPVQTPQREWLRGPLRSWAQDRIDVALQAVGHCWLDEAAVRREWAAFAGGQGDNSYFVWTWLNLGLAIEQRPEAFARLS